MSVNEAILPERYSGGAPQPPLISLPITVTTTDRHLLHRQIPAVLNQYARQESWQFVCLEEVHQNKLQPTIQNLYIDEMLLKAHGPNWLFGQVRRTLASDSYFAFRVTTAENIKACIQQRLSGVSFYGYYGVHFLVRRALPKLKGFRKICRLLNAPVDMSKAEIIGRLMYNGFELVDIVETVDETLFVAKINPLNNPSESKPESNEGCLFRMQRIGKHGKPITVYKFRSMHPYAEYVQEYLHKTNGIDLGGKFKNDFRVSTGGRLIRKYWIDELPMLINLLKGDIKLLGVRPISEHYFSLYPEAAQQLRRQHKPGLLPPYYADLPTTFEQIVQSEVNYLTRYERDPVATDLTYLLKIMKNIVIHKARSK
ncbi:sugar transferase [Spirosoma sp. RP8]|uniref:Sugar transferase n=1 Tax=Spirosoma liriopis TaxID=2937440 RepID=A0ABT0HRS4_9BACT|nr:sugar transferase [Spirosoma liriopis]MCK8494878.1 sugar transferase [Spirosoma liriopis]